MIIKCFEMKRNEIDKTARKINYIWLRTLYIICIVKMSKKKETSNFHLKFQYDYKTYQRNKKKQIDGMCY